MNLRSIFRQCYIVVHGEDELPAKSVRAQVHATVFAVLEEWQVEDSIDEVEGEPAFHSREEFMPEHIFTEQAAYACSCDDGVARYRVAVFGSKDDPEFRLTRVVVPNDGNPMGMDFVGDSPDIMGAAEEAHWEGNPHDGKLPAGLRALIRIMANPAFDEDGVSVGEVLSSSPDGEFARHVGAVPELRTLLGL